MNFPVVQLSDLCEMDRRGLGPDDSAAARLPFVGVENVESQSGSINVANGSRVKSQRSMTFRFDERHVLYAKLRPYLNKVATPNFAGRCSTELIPLLPRDDVDREFVAHLLRREQTVEYIMMSVNGSRMPRADMKALMSLPVRLPPLDEQRRIVGILNRAAKIKQMRQQAQELMQEFVPALFVEMFGSQEKIGVKYPCMPLREVAEIASGVTKGRKIESSNAVEVPYLRVANVQDGFLNLDEIKAITIQRGEEQKYALAPGDLVMTEGGDQDKLGRAAVWNGELDYCAHQNHVFRVRPNAEVVLADYLRDVSGSAYGKSYFLSVAKRTTGIASVNKTQLGGFPVPMPPMELQALYAKILVTAHGISSVLEAAASGVATLRSSLVSRLLESSP